MTALTSTVGHAGQPADLWHAIRAADAPASWSLPMPTVEPHQRPSACVLAIGSRLAPLTAGEPDHELRVFLNGLPQPVMDATARLAARVLPDPEPGRPTAASPADMVTDRLRALQLAGPHRASPPGHKPAPRVARPATRRCATPPS